MSVRVKLISVLLLAGLLLSSCSNLRIESKKYVEDAADLISDRIVSSGISVDKTLVKTHESGGEYYASISIFIEDCSEEEASRIFDEIIFPYMSNDNAVVGDLLMVGSTYPVYYIALCHEEAGEEISWCYYKAERRMMCEIWENGEDTVILEDYR